MDPEIQIWREQKEESTSSADGSDQRKKLLRCGTRISRCRIKLKKQEYSSSSNASKRSGTKEMQAHFEQLDVAQSLLNVTYFDDS